ncbi:MAG: hypothetical protein IT538_09015 [Variibacter sp.]|nr:hypothetical protein [Variibacter sp.]
MTGVISAIVRALVAAKATPEMILAAVEAAEQSNMDKLTARRAKDAERQARFRDRNVTNVTQRDTSTAVASHAGTRAEPETNNSSENKGRKEGRKEEPPAAATPSPKPSKTLCPPEYEPPAKAFELGVSLGLDRGAVFAARDTMVAWSRGNGEKRLDWDAVFGNWLRRDAKDSAKARGSPPRGQAANDAAMMALNRAAHQRLLELDDDDAWQQTSLGPPS